jgi:DNA recombination-dependent growth factor C
VGRLGLTYQDGLAFQLAAYLTVHRLRFPGIAELEEDAELDEAARLDADFAFMVEALAPLLARIVEVFGESG